MEREYIGIDLHKQFFQFWKAVDGSGDEERLTTSENLQTPTSWSADGKHLAFNETSSATGNDLWTLPVDQRKPAIFLHTPSSETAARFSPDGRWLAYSSNESGTTEIYVRPFPGSGVKLQVSVEGGIEPVWSRTGRGLFYRQGDRMMAVSMSPQAVLTAGSPRALFEASFMRSDTGGAGYDVAADGRFLLVQPAEPELPATHINVVLNWFDELKQRVPVK